MDCEGAEAELADPEAVPWLAGARLLIELHPAIHADIRERLERRFEPTHELELIGSQVRRASTFDGACARSVACVLQPGQVLQLVVSHSPRI